MRTEKRALRSSIDGGASERSSIYAVYFSPCINSWAFASKIQCTKTAQKTSKYQVDASNSKRLISMTRLDYFAEAFGNELFR